LPFFFFRRTELVNLAKISVDFSRQLFTLNPPPPPRNNVGSGKVDLLKMCFNAGMHEIAANVIVH
jgi:hypothetical protein